jgi:hypothetical protein
VFKAQFRIKKYYNRYIILINLPHDALKAHVSVEQTVRGRRQIKFGQYLSDEINDSFFIAVVFFLEDRLSGWG